MHRAQLLCTMHTVTYNGEMSNAILTLTATWEADKIFEASQTLSRTFSFSLERDCQIPSLARITCGFGNPLGAGGGQGVD